MRTAALSEINRGSGGGLVNALAWLFILAGGLTALAVSAILLAPQFSLPVTDILAALEPKKGGGGLAAGAYWLVESRGWFLGLLLLGSVLTIFAASALLRRQRWARQVFVTLMSFGFVFTFAAIALTPLVFGMLPDGSLVEIDPANPIGGMVTVLAAGIVGATVLSGVFGWVGWKLTTPQIRAEFE